MATRKKKAAASETKRQQLERELEEQAARARASHRHGLPDSGEQQGKLRESRAALGRELQTQAEVLAAALELARPSAERLGCLDELLRIPNLVREGGGAGLQRRDHERGGMSAVLTGLLDRTAGD